MNPPLVSVLLTAWNREKYVGEAIERVLASTFTDFELIIVDDASTDGTVDIIRQYAEKDKRIRFYVNEKNIGDYPNRNKVASYATGKYLKYTDSDDVLYAHALQVLVAAMEAFPEAGFCLCTDADPQRPYPVMITGREAYLEHFYGYDHFSRAPGSSIIKREAFERVGGFSGRRIIGDNELWFKLANYYSMVKINGGLYWDRNHGDQERFTAFANKNYRKMRHMVLLEAFAHKDCPLTPEEREKALNRVNRNNRKKKILKAMYEFKDLFVKRKDKYDRLW
jgi:glycosyltransferase involved in cell wall biosynthesis